VRNVLIHAGIMKGEPEIGAESVMLDMPDDDCFVFATG
jgi:N-alpha-acetyl-L-2,4-diaminobutyrate deacetylase